uniref:Uncharacterized protein n=1 Tax=Arundo donax TaxID=35708 RepID=A0A0A9BBW4_ARUDO
MYFPGVTVLIRSVVKKCRYLSFQTIMSLSSKRA